MPIILNWSNLFTPVTYEPNSGVGRCKRCETRPTEIPTKMLIHRSKASSTPVAVKLMNFHRQSSWCYTFNKQLPWSDHFNHVLRSASDHFHTWRSLKPLIPKAKLVEVFRGPFAFFFCTNPQFSGCNLFHTSRFEKVKKRDHRIICNPPDRVTPRLYETPSITFCCW